jgi:hypothetical protein
MASNDHELLVERNILIQYELIFFKSIFRDHLFADRRRVPFEGLFYFFSSVGAHSEEVITHPFVREVLPGTNGLALVLVISQDHPPGASDFP